jgi:hypothetical protein
LAGLEAEEDEHEEKDEVRDDDVISCYWLTLLTTVFGVLYWVLHS